MKKGLAFEPGPFEFVVGGGGSNSRPSHCERDALPAANSLNSKIRQFCLELAAKTET